MSNFDPEQITIIADKVSSDIELKIAIIGLLGALIGACIPTAGNWLLYSLQRKPQAELDKKRKDLLKNILNDPKYIWSKIETLANVIGADEEETKRLLIEIEARGSRTGKGLWALLSKKPLPDMDKDEE